MLTILLLFYAVGLASCVPLHDDFTPRPGETCGYESCTQAEEGMLNVHIVPHTHDDVGWLKTVDQYYYGSRNDIQKAGVQYILDSVIKELWEDPKRRFIYVETAFFWKWWVKQSDNVRHKVHTLVLQGRLQFVGGAWSMNDEAASHYQSTIDHFTWGLSKLNQTFGPCGMPRVGWQIDPFGHSREFASLLAAMGYDGLFLGRIDYQDKRVRLNKKTMEMVWRGDDVLGKSSDIFTGVLYNTYSPPPGFCFDVLCNDEPIIDDPDSPMYNVEERVNEFVKIVSKMADGYKTNNVLVTMGEDFQYQDAAMWFINLDKLIKFTRSLSKFIINIVTGSYRVNYLSSRYFDSVTTNAALEFLQYIGKQSKSFRTRNVILTMGGDFTYQDATMWYTNLDRLIKYVNLKAAKEELNVKLFYSTPDCYLKAVKDSNPTLPIKQDDFFPYASDPNSYWTGYFTSRPTTKYFEREGNSYLQMVKQLQVLAGLEDHNRFLLNELKSAMGVMQHHDAITGTEKQHVTHDYERLLNNAIEDAIIIARQAFNKIQQGDALKPPLFTYDRCRFNESSCPTSENSEQFVVTVYNHLAWDVIEPIRIPVVDGNYAVYAPNGDQLKIQMGALSNAVKNIPTRESKATHDLFFIAHLKPLSIKSYYIKKLQNKTKRDIQQSNFNTHCKIDGNNECFSIESQENKVKKAKNLDSNKDSKRNREYYGNLNDYWDKIKDQTKVDIKNIEEDYKKSMNAQDYRKSINTPQDEYYEKPMNKPQDSVIVIKPKIPDYERNNKDLEVMSSDNDFDINVLRDKNENIDVDLEELEKLIRESKKIENFDNQRDVVVEKKVNYPILNEEEMRMLSDEPRIVEAPKTTDYGNEHLRLHVDETNKQMHVSLNNDDPDKLSLDTNFAYYPGCVGDNHDSIHRSSGAYIFRPNTTAPVKIDIEYDTTVGPVFVERTSKIDGNVASVIRLYKEPDFIEHEWLIGPINIDDDLGKEYIVTYDTNVVNNGEFYTDSNGRQLLKRKLNQRPQWNLTLEEPIGGNYYPVTNEIFIQDDKFKVAILTDRSEGGSSLLEGRIELMLHRRLLHDDAFGVGEALNETAKDKGLVVRGRHRIIISKPNNLTDLLIEKKQLYQLHLQPQVFVSDAKDLSLDSWLKLNNCFSFGNKLPDGVHLLTLEPWFGTTLLLRLENYLENGVVQVDMNDIFKKLKLKSFRETKLAANQWMDGSKWVWNVEEDFSSSFNKHYGSFAGVDEAKDVMDEVDDGFVVKIKPKQIRTFVVDYEINS